MLQHPDVRAISFVGSTPVAKYIYAQAAAHGKRVQCQGGAKNHVLILPDADIDSASKIVSDSAFGCAGQRCLAVSVAITVGEAQKNFTDEIANVASVAARGQRPGSRSADGAGDHPGKQDSDRRADRERREQTAPKFCWMAAAETESRQREIS